MSVALVITSDNEARHSVRWAWRFARSQDSELVVIVAQKGTGATEWDVIQTADECEQLIPNVYRSIQDLPEEEAPREPTAAPTEIIDVSVRRLRAADPSEALAGELPSLDVDILLIPFDGPIDDASDWKVTLFRDMPCETVLLRATCPQQHFKRILVPTSGSDNADAALTRALRMAARYDAEVTALYVTSAVDRFATQVGQRILERIVKTRRGRRSTEHSSSYCRDGVTSTGTQKNSRTTGLRPGGGGWVS